MRSCLLFLVCITLAIHAAGQRDNVRRQLDSERDGSYLDDKMLEKARSFVRRDSTYYLGYLLEGAYLFFRANDKLGFTKAIAPLKKAMDKIEYDYDPLLRLRTSNFSIYNANYRYHFDYGLITYFLNRCYQNVEQQDKAMEVLYHIRDRNFQVEVNMDSYNTMAWIFHRNRVYTSKQFPFLKNSVRENVMAANRYLDSALLKIRSDFPVNNGLYDPNFLNRQYLTTFHYKAMIYDYLLDVDSASYYYDMLIQNEAYSSNNYAEFKLAMGEFETAELFFREAEERSNNVEKTTKEYYYMRGTLAIYRGHPEEADTLLANVLQQQGSTPGYGWHCIGMARAQHYEGLTAESQDRANKAARFQELHIGTTWGQEQYNLAVESLNYLNQSQFQKEYWFEHDEWYFWLNPVNWYRWVKYTLEARHHKMVLASLVAENPERSQVIYSIFSPENLMTFDEVWSVIDGFGNEYFIDEYQARLKTDKRPRVKKYIRYFLGKLYLAEGKDSEAIRYFNDVLRDPDMDDPYQTMLRARTLEGLAMASSGNERQNYVQQLYALYPQLMPFTNLTMNFHLQESASSADEKKIIEDLTNCSLDFSDDSDIPTASISFSAQGEALDILYQVELKGTVMQNGVLRIQKSELENAGKILAYRLFGIQKVITGEHPKATEPVKEKTEEKPV